MRIGIVNDLRTTAELLRRIISASGEHEILWIARDGAEAVSLCQTNLPGLVLMDLIMPYLDGVEATRQIMSRTPCPILILTASVGENASKVFEALGAGALDALDVPARNAFQKTGRALLLKIKGIERQTFGSENLANQPTPKLLTTASQLVLIGASAGGPTAVAAVLSALPQDFSPGVIIVQHIDAQFLRGFVVWLNEHSARPVRLAREGEPVPPGSVLVAQSRNHLVFKSPSRLGYTADPVESPYRPSIDVFFASAAQYFKGTMAAVLLSGMGRDGAEGLKKLRTAGYRTIAQDENSSAVYGMPKVAAAIDAAIEILPLDMIGPRLKRLFEAEVRPIVTNRAEPCPVMD
jgi:two-component system, chemotaxis family, response regulator WspF